MELKCVGGPADGEMREVKPGELKIAVMQEIRSTAPKKYLQAEQLRTIYTVRTMRAAGGEISFLSPEDWNDFQALQHQFSK